MAKGAIGSALWILLSTMPVGTGSCLTRELAMRLTVNVWRVWLPVLLICLVSLPGVAAGATVYYVDDGAPGGGDGASWESAFNDLQEALYLGIVGDEIHIAGGTYRPAPANGDPNVAFHLLDRVAIYGGFAGYGAPDPDERNIFAYETILSGDLNDDDSTGGHSDNSHHVVVADHAIDQRTILDGVTVTGGFSTDLGGGGMLNFGGPWLNECTFRQNSAEYGGGLFNDRGSPLLSSCTFEDNTAVQSGGAMYDFSFPGDESPSLVYCAFNENSAGSRGGGMRVYDSSPTLFGCSFYYNTCRFDGAAMANGGTGSPMVTNCTFSWNRTDTLFGVWDSFGGAMSNFDDNSPVLRNCTFYSNSAHSLLPGLSFGGAIANGGNSAPAIIHCTFKNNDANVSDGLHNMDSSSPSLDGCILWNGGDEIGNDDLAAITVTYSDVDGDWFGEGNIDQNPLFDGLRLSPSSPCINKGDPQHDPGTSPIDLDGHFRVLCLVVDMGAYEFGIGDFDCDRNVDLTDYENWTDCMTGPDLGMYPVDCEPFDFDFDCDVDLSDFARFQAVFGDG